MADGTEHVELSTSSWILKLKALIINSKAVILNSNFGFSTRRSRFSQILNSNFGFSEHEIINHSFIYSTPPSILRHPDCSYQTCDLVNCLASESRPSS